MLTSLDFKSKKDLFDSKSEFKINLQFYLVSGALCTILLPPEYNNPFLLLIGLNSLINRDLALNFKKSLRRPAVYLPFLLWLLYALSYTYSEDKIYALKSIEKLAALGLFPFVLALGPKLNSDHVFKLKWHYVISITILSMYSIVYSFIQMFGNGGFKFDWLLLSYENLVSGIGAQPLYFSMFIALALFFLFDYQRNYKASFLQLIIIAFLFLYMLMLSTRMTTLAFFMIFLVYTAFVSFKTRAFAYHLFTFILFLITALGVIVFNPVNKKRFEEALNPNSNYQTDQYGGRSIRIEKWKCSLEVFSNSPIFGVGAGDLKGELMKCYDRNSVDAALFYEFNSHNQYLNTAGQTGLIGLFLLICLLVFSVFHAFKIESDTFLIFIILFSVCIFSESMLSRRWGIFFFTLFYSIFHLYESKNSRDGVIKWFKLKWGKND